MACAGHEPKLFRLARSGKIAAAVFDRNDVVREAVDDE
jgi:hypothetical protein